MSAGGFLGFIFGIPSLLQNPALHPETVTTLKYNDNLVQISDWLTKIIVGVGLTQLNSIPHSVMSLGEYLSPNFGSDPWGRNASLAIVFYFLLFGFLMIYFWTRTDFTTIMKETDDDMQKKLDTVEKQKQKLTAQDKLNAKQEENMQLENLDFDASKILPPIKNADDPQKGRFGGKAENNGRKLNATVTPGSSDSFFDITIWVESTDSKNPLNTDVIFYLHDSLRPSVYAIKPGEFVDGKAIDNTIRAWGAFTVGAITDNGDTLLELDLAELPDAPKLFRER